MNFPWLTALLVLPIVGAVVVLAMPRGRELPKHVAFLFSLATLVLGVVAALQFKTSVTGMQLTEIHQWIPTFGAHYALGVNAIGLSLVLLTVILTPVVILASWHDGDDGRWSANAFFAWMLVLEGLAIGVFTAIDVLLFYVLFEATLIPIYFLIGGYGGAKRSRAAVKFLVYSLLGGLVMLVSVIGLYVVGAQSTNGPSYLLSDLSQLSFSTDTGRWLFLGFFIAFAIKAPMFPVHTWLPDTVDEGTAGTSVLLVSILDKIGTFGMIRYALGLFPEASHWATPVVLVLAIISILYGALLAIAQNSIPRLIGYTSVSHFGFIVLGIFVLNAQGGVGSVFYMFNHGLSTAALFLVGGYLIKRRGSKYISDFGGVEKGAPVLAGFFLVAGLSALALPGLSPFISEYLVITGAFVYNWWYAAFAVLGIVLAALYVLLMYQRTMTGPPRPETAGVTDLNAREIIAIAPVIALIVVLGFYPKPLLDAFNPAVGAYVTHAQTVAAAAPAGTSKENTQ